MISLKHLIESVTAKATGRYYYRVHPKGDIKTVIGDGLYSYSPSDSPGAYVDAPDMNTWPDESNNYRFYVADSEWKSTEDRFQIRIPDDNISNLEKDHLGDYYVDTGHNSEKILEPNQYDVKMGGRWVRADMVEPLMTKAWRHLHHKSAGHFKNKFYDEPESDSDSEEDV